MNSEFCATICKSCGVNLLGYNLLVTGFAALQLVTILTNIDCAWCQGIEQVTLASIGTEFGSSRNEDDWRVTSSLLFGQADSALEDPMEEPGRERDIHWRIWK